MEKKQSKLCLEILKRFNNAGILNNFILIGSWCIYFYHEFFLNVSYSNNLTIRTRDIDFLIDNPAGIQQEIDIPELLKDLGFVIVYKSSKGYIKLEHPDLILEFLVPEKGRGTDKPVNLPKLGMNAVALRFLNFLSDRTITVKIENFHIILPHPAYFALHKLIIFQRRSKADKAAKDRITAIAILKALIKKGDSTIIKHAFDSIPQKWQKKVLKGLNKIEDKDILTILVNPD